jgi:hypothetical protein
MPGWILCMGMAFRFFGADRPWNAGRFGALAQDGDKDVQRNPLDAP